VLLFEFAHSGAQMIAFARRFVAIGGQLLDLFLPLVEAGLHLLLARLLLRQIHIGLAEPCQQRDALRFGEVQIALRLFECVRQLRDPIALRGHRLLGDGYLFFRLIAKGRDAAVGHVERLIGRSDLVTQPRQSILQIGIGPFGAHDRRLLCRGKPLITDIADAEIARCGETDHRGRPQRERLWVP